jgi:hypothetical protein
MRPYRHEENAQRPIIRLPAGCRADSWDRSALLARFPSATQRAVKKHGFDVVSKESAGGHTWINWRDYLSEFAPLLFVEK